MNYTVAQVCQTYGVSRQAYYKRQKATAARLLEEQMIVDRVLAIRKRQPMIGGRKLHKILNPQLREMGIYIGRDCLFDILRRHKLLIYPRKKYVRTTYSYHRFKTYKNLIKNLEIKRVNQVYVSDITYITLVEDFCYLALITDAYSRKIVGYDLSQSLSIDGSLRAVKMALKNVEHPERLIHHSDRGIQYCSHAYVDMLTNKEVKISMTEENHVYENAIAERVNGILKTEFLLGEKLASFEVAKELVKESIKIYNEERPHMSIDYLTPQLKHAA